jgi:hypothetical protein
MALSSLLHYQIKRMTAIEVSLKNNKYAHATMVKHFNRINNKKY